MAKRKPKAEVTATEKVEENVPQERSNDQMERSNDQMERSNDQMEAPIESTVDQKSTKKYTYKRKLRRL